MDGLHLLVVGHELLHASGQLYDIDMQFEKWCAMWHSH